MIVDTSALVAILQEEEELELFSDAIDQTEFPCMSVVSFVEASIVIESRKGGEGLQRLERTLQLSRIELVPVDEEQARLARSAFSRYGKGRHPAGLNFGDCFAYALAIAKNQTLLFKGDDFGRTDVVPAVGRETDS